MYNLPVHSAGAKLFEAIDSIVFVDINGGDPAIILYILLLLLPRIYWNVSLYSTTTPSVQPLGGSGEAGFLVSYPRAGTDCFRLLTYLLTAPYTYRNTMNIEGASEHDWPILSRGHATGSFHTREN